MSDADDRRAAVTDEEIRALLGVDCDDDECGGDGVSSLDESAMGVAADSRLRGARVLIASRRRRDVGLLVERLRARGVEIDGVRGGFRVLDLLRVREYAAVVSDVELWVDRGDLLVERVDLLEPRPAVVFLRARSTVGDSAFAVTVAGAGVLPCPLTPGEAELAAETIVAAAGGRVSSAGDASSSARAEAADAPLDDGRRLATGRGLPASPRASHLLRGSDRREEGEVAWLRFFLEAWRLARRADGVDSFRLEVARLACDVLGAGAAGVSFSRDGRRELAAIAHDARHLGELAQRLDSTERARPAVDSLRVDVDAESLVIVGLPTAVAMLASAHADDLHHLLTSGLNARS